MKAVWITGALIALFCVAAGVGVITSRVTYPAYTHRIKVFIDIEDRGEARSGSGVLEVELKFGLPVGPGLSCTIRGDAIPIELKGGPVVAVLHQYYNEYLPTGGPAGQTRAGFCTLALVAYGLGGTPSQDALQALASKSGRVGVPHRGIPSFVFFSDPKIPSTAKLVLDEELSSSSRTGRALA